MREPGIRAFMELVAGRRGLFRLASGYHGGLWLHLYPLFAEPRRISPLVDTLVNALRPYNVAGVCGPLLGGAFLAQLVAHALEVEFSFTERVPASQTSGFYQTRYRVPG